MSNQELPLEQARKDVWVEVLRLAIQGLGHDDITDACFEWMQERAQAVKALRKICSNYGDNEWADNLPLAEVIEQHLACHL